MSWIVRIILGFIISAIGFVIVWRVNGVLELLGPSSWAETKFATWGGSSSLYRLVGVVIIFIGLMVMTNLHFVFLTWLTGPLLRPQRI
ncbi:hypothetical protein HYV72_00880 [Candidatus Uhrbacteria bacterium]|nr:hypothetical protein [Candidatus Uhrbacteria bacterium]